MKITLAILALIASFQSAARATDLIVDRVVIKKHPIATPYYAAMTVRDGKEESSFHEAKKAYGTTGGIDAGDIEIRPHLVLKNVQLQSWGSFTLQLDHKDAVVKTAQAASKHTGRFQLLSGSHDNTFIPSLSHPAFAYRVYWHTL